MNWTEYFRDIAISVSKKSKDKRVKIGAVIVGSNNQIISTGYNSFPRGIFDDDVERHSPDEKLFWVEHAEKNAIYNAASSGVSTSNGTMYLSEWFPCHECTKAIINSGIKKIYCDKLHGALPSKWEKSMKISMQMLKEADIDICYYQDAPFWKDKLAIDDIIEKANILGIYQYLIDTKVRIMKTSPEFTELQAFQEAFNRLQFVETL